MNDTTDHKCGTCACWREVELGYGDCEWTPGPIANGWSVFKSASLLYPSDYGSDCPAWEHQYRD